MSSCPSLVATQVVLPLDARQMSKKAAGPSHSKCRRQRSVERKRNARSCWPEHCQLLQCNSHNKLLQFQGPSHRPNPALLAAPGATRGVLAPGMKLQSFARTASRVGNTMFLADPTRLECPSCPSLAATQVVLPLDARQMSNKTAGPSHSKCRRQRSVERKRNARSCWPEHCQLLQCNSHNKLLQFQGPSHRPNPALLAAPGATRGVLAPGMKLQSFARTASRVGNTMFLADPTRLECPSCPSLAATQVVLPLDARQMSNKTAGPSHSKCRRRRSVERKRNARSCWPEYCRLLQCNSHNKLLQFQGPSHPPNPALLAAPGATRGALAPGMKLQSFARQCNVRHHGMPQRIIPFICDILAIPADEKLPAEPHRPANQCS